MTALLAKFAPCAIVLAAVTYCCWPYLEDAGQKKADADKKLPEIAASALAPKIQPAPGRDPFGMTLNPDVFKVIETKDAKKDPKLAVAAGQPNKGTTGPADKSKVDPRGNSAAQDLDPEIQKKITENELKTARNGLMLNATFLRGNRHVAILNGERFSEGDTLERVNSNLRLIKIAAIQPRKVVLEKQGQTIDVDYPDLLAAANGTARKPNGAAGARPATPTRPTSRQAPRPGQTRPATNQRAKPRSAARSTMMR